MTKFCIWTPDGQGGVKQEIIESKGVQITRPSKGGFIIRINGKIIKNAVGITEVMEEKKA